MLFGSIKTKIMLAIVLCSVLTVSLVGFASWYSSKQMIEEQMYQNAQYLVENKAKDLNNTIEKIESSVDYLSVAVLSMLDDVEKFKTDDGYIYSHGTIEPLTPTDFSQYDPNDLEHVGWYYIPVSEEMSASVEEIADGNRQQSVSIDTCVRITSDLSHKFQELQDETGGVVSQLDGMNGENRRTFELIRQLEEKTARANRYRPREM